MPIAAFIAGPINREDRRMLVTKKTYGTEALYTVIIHVGLWISHTSIKKVSALGLHSLPSITDCGNIFLYNNWNYSALTIQTSNNNNIFSWLAIMKHDEQT